jgi:hypothetical protein
LAKNKTEKSCYASRFGAGWISAEQFLAENMCSRKGRSEGNELAPFFWREKYWEKEFLKQLRFARELVEQYSVEAIVAALRHPDAKKIYSFGLKSVLIPLISKEQRRIDTKEEIKQYEKPYVPEHVDIYKQPRKPFGRSPSLLQRLRDLENGKEKNIN